MLIYPAVDLRAGSCVRLLHGRFDQVTTYGADPAARLRGFAGEGASWAHVVDLDGARNGAPVQHELIAELAADCGLKLQAGGGVRRRADVEALLEAGVARVVVGSVAVRRPEEVRAWLAAFGADRLCLALDVRPVSQGYEVAVQGWATASGRTPAQVLAEFRDEGLRHVLATDVSRDGAMVGPNLDLAAELSAASSGLEVQASGGVGGLDDLRALRARGAAGVIVGRALYEGRFSLREALDAG